MFDRSNALQDVAQAGRFGDLSHEPGLILQQRHHLGIAQLTIWPGQEAALTECLHAEWDVILPDSPVCAAMAGEASLFRVGPDTCWLVTEAEEHPAERARAWLDPAIAVVADISHAYTALRLRGDAVRAVLAKGLPLDLHPSVFPVHAIAVSAVQGMALVVLRCGEMSAECFDIFVARSLAVSFWRWLTQAAAEFGYAVL